MGYSHVSLEDLDTYEQEDPERTVLPVGVELRPENLRTNVWEYEEGQTSNRHYQQEQEELYVPLSGRFEMEIEDQDGNDDAVVELEPDDHLVVDPQTVRLLTAIEAGRILVVGAPNAKDDGVVVE